ncbi:unnamed protein product [Dicrocoelium dendriticum]|nr:unnamed protein product [Dicrocoelium dendriticum]
MSKTAEAKQLVSKLRQLVSDVELPGEPDFLKDGVLLLFLKSRNWDLRSSEQMLRKALNWRKEIQPRTLQCDQCHWNPGCHSLRQIGHDETGRPVLYASFFPAHPSQRNSLNGALVHLIFVIENAIRSMLSDVNQWVFVIDCASKFLYFESHYTR